MPTVIWTAVFFLLCFEAAVCLISMVPLPKQAWLLFGKGLSNSAVHSFLIFAMRFLALGLSLGVFESVQSIQGLQSQIFEADPNDMYAAVKLSTQKQRMFRSERNLYLAGFCLALLFIIRRIVLMSIHNAQMEDELDKRAVGSSSSSTAAAAVTSSTAAAAVTTSVDAVDAGATSTPATVPASGATYEREDGVPYQRK